ncbi:helix-turn-helix domain-containing protein [Shouchella miscanthi]|uniref:helix-turn-helix domain-containing protein n=1 Tax=Shouchella miscanthi TaxID=2598861 RepID=UPI001643F4EA|nr:helix-turn-helix transcriptional regulator [Shouchella miscanthi]
MYGRRLASLRKQKKLSQEALTQILGINRSTYARYETEKTQPDFDTLQQLANFYDVTIDYLLGRTDNPNSDISIAHDGGPQYEDEDEREFIEQQLEQYRKMKKRFQEEVKRDKRG